MAISGITTEDGARGRGYSRHTSGHAHRPRDLGHAPTATPPPRSFERDHGLAAAGGGRHDGMGTHNRIVPLGGGYLELLAVADAEEAAGSPLGRTVTERLAASARAGWAGRCVVDDVDAGRGAARHRGERDLARGLQRAA